MYKDMLREYRRLQSELSPWMQTFEKKNGRQPLLLDAEATQIAWLTTTFKQYLLMRSKLFKDIPSMKRTIAEAPKTTPEKLSPNKERCPVASPEARMTSNSNIAALTHELIPSSSMCQYLTLSQ